MVDVLADIVGIKVRHQSDPLADIDRFYNNQVRKDKELSEKIAWFQDKARCHV